LRRVKIKIPVQHPALKEFIRSAHRLTFRYENAFNKIDHFYKRFEYEAKVIYPGLWTWRECFYLYYKRDKQFQKEFWRYMYDQKDFVFWTNTLMSAPNQLRHPDLADLQNGNPNAPFVARIYQVLDWEFGLERSTATLKPREVGLSYEKTSGLTMLQIIDPNKDYRFFSDKQDKVDIKDDFRQTGIGRLRGAARDSRILRLEGFYDDKLLRLQTYEKGGALQGSSTTPTAANQGRVHYIMIDEVGLQKRFHLMKREIGQSGRIKWYVGTLCPGPDMGFREVLDEADKYVMPIEDITRDYIRLMGENITYQEIMGRLKFKYLSDVPKGSTIAMPIKLHHDPLKRGGDCFEQLSNEVMNDKIAIATQLKADRFAQNEGASLWAIDPDLHFLSDEHFDTIEKEIRSTPSHVIHNRRNGVGRGWRWLLGFDPGTHKSASITPIAWDGEHGYYVFPNEMMEKGDLRAFIAKVSKKYPGATWYPEASVYAYKNIGSGWYYELVALQDLYGYDIRVAENINVRGILMIVNGALNKRAYCHLLKQDNRPLFHFHRRNREWVLNYEAGVKNEFSHRAESLIAMIYRDFEWLQADLVPKAYSVM